MTDVQFVSKNTSFVVTASETHDDYPEQFRNIIENWEHYDYRVGKIEIIGE